MRPGAGSGDFDIGGIDQNIRCARLFAEVRFAPLVGQLRFRDEYAWLNCGRDPQ